MNIYETIVNLQKTGQVAVLITVVNKEGHGPQIPGAKLLVCADGRKIGTIGGGTLEHVAINESTEIFKTKKSFSKKYLLGENTNIADAVKTGMICGGNISLFYEYIAKKDNVIIFGAGHVGKALAALLKPLSYNITIIDSREEILNEIKDFNTQLIKNYDNMPAGTVEIDNTYIVITTHSHELDYRVLKNVYESDCSPKYIGMIASNKKSEKMIERLTSEIEGTIDFSHLYTPIGLKIGGKSPEEIALSIASELQVIKYNQPDNRHARRDWKQY